MTLNACLRLLRPLRFCVWAFVLSGFSLRLAGQNTTGVNADCTISFRITATNGSGPSAGSFDNRQVGCNFWQASYQSTGFTALTLAVQSATAAAGPFGTMGGTVVFGTNPLNFTTAESNLIEASGVSFSPFVRIIATATTGTGEIRGVLLGWRTAGAAGAGAGLGTGSVNIVQVGGQNVPSTASAMGAVFPTGIFNAAGWANNFFCDNTQPFNITASGNTSIIPTGGASGNLVRVCHISFSTTAAEDIKFVQGGGANCATVPADVTGVYKSVQSMALDLSNGSPMTYSAPNGLCINQSAAQLLGGVVIYATAF